MDWRESVVSRLMSLFTCTSIHLAKRVDEWVQPSNSSIPGTDQPISDHIGRIARSIVSIVTNQGIGKNESMMTPPRTAGYAAPNRADSR